MATVGVVAVVWALRERHYRTAAIVLVAGTTALNLATVVWVEAVWALALLAVPIGIAMLMLGASVGFFGATACTLALAVLPEYILPAPPGLRAVTAIGIWGTSGLLWLVLQPLLTTVQWMWDSYAREHALLQRMQEAQVQLTQTLNDLKSANLQLTRLNQLANGLRQVAEDALRTKEQFVANVSHELRTPLNMIIGFSEMILNAPHVYGKAIPSALLSDLAVILRNSRHLSDLIDDVLDLSQIEAGRMALVKERVDLREVVEAALVAVRPLFESKRLSLEVRIENELPMVSCDRTRIREVLLNLLSNAGRFTERGGVVVSVTRERAAAGAGDILLSVADTGSGIASEDLSKVFQPFEQLDGSIRRRHGGSGLGLAISKRFVELHGGRMWVESALGQGTTFYFTLPVDPPAPIRDDAARWLNPDWPLLERTHASLAPLPVVKPRFVVIDPAGVLMHALTRYLDDAEVVGVKDLPEAITQLERVPTHMLIINSMQMDEWLVRLGAIRLPYDAPALICSLMSQADSMHRLGISDYLVKPINREALLRAVRRTISNVPRQSLGAHSFGELDLSTSLRNVPHSDELPTVLVVDDEPDARRLFWRMLSGSPPAFHVLTASDGQQAIEIMRSQRPDVVLLDLVMPNLSGFQFLALKNADPELQAIPVIVVSARDPASQPVLVHSIGVTSPRGLSMRQLLTCIENLSRLLSPLAAPADPVPKAPAHD